MMVGRGGELRKLGIAVGIVGVLWLAYFWLAVCCYPRFHFVMPNLKSVQTFTLLSGVACASDLNCGGYCGGSLARLFLASGLLLSAFPLRDAESEECPDLHPPERSGLRFRSELRWVLWGFSGSPISG